MKGSVLPKYTAVTVNDVWNVLTNETVLTIDVKIKITKRVVKEEEKNDSMKVSRKGEKYFDEHDDIKM